MIQIRTISTSAVGKIPASLNYSTKIPLKHPLSNHRAIINRKERVRISAKWANDHSRSKKLTLTDLFYQVSSANTWKTMSNQEISRPTSPKLQKTNLMTSYELFLQIFANWSPMNTQTTWCRNYSPYAIHSNASSFYKNWQVAFRCLWETSREPIHYKPWLLCLHKKRSTALPLRQPKETYMNCHNTPMLHISYKRW